jgi:hypothetical protein
MSKDDLYDCYLCCAETPWTHNSGSICVAICADCANQFSIRDLNDIIWRKFNNTNGKKL